MAEIGMPLIALKNINKSYQTGATHTQVLCDLTLDVNTNDLIAIVGTSGSGKSTLMNIIGLIDKADNGSYLLDGKAVSSFNDKALAHARNVNIGFIFQQFHLLSRLTVIQNVMLPLHYRDLPMAASRAQALKMLERVDMVDFAERKPNQLSGGQQQRVAIARALVGDPQLILADEPTGALDSKTSAHIMQLLKHLHQDGRTVLIITHDPTIASQCSRQIQLVDGAIVAEHRG